MEKYKPINTEENYNKLLSSGLFWNFFPELSGLWNKDKKIINATEELKIRVNVSNEKFEIGDLICDGIKVIKATSRLVEAQGLVNRRNWRKVINKLTHVEEFIQEINERIEELQKDPTDVNIGKVAELSLVLLRLNKVNKEVIKKFTEELYGKINSHKKTAKNTGNCTQVYVDDIFEMIQETEEAFK